MWKRRAPGWQWGGPRAERRAYLAGVKLFEPIAPLALVAAVVGSESYSVGAGMARQYVLATFLRWNMPYDLAGTLSTQDAADIAAWLLRRPRPDHPGKERDWPNGDFPSDVAYATDGARARGLAPPVPRPLLRRRMLPNQTSR